MYEHGSEIRRVVNDQIAEIARTNIGTIREERWEFLCECGNPRCRRHVRLTVEEFRAARASEDPVVVAAHTPLVHG